MITNSSVTIYHKYFDEQARIEKWQRYNYDRVWFFGGKGASVNKGYQEANDVEIRIPYSTTANLNISNFAIGDIIVQGKIETDIQTQQDLNDYLTYNITSIKNNNFGKNKHIHIGGK